MKKSLTVLAVAIFFVSCQVPKNAESLASSLELKIKLHIPGGQARSYVQGKTTSSSYDRYKPYCEIEVYNVSDGSNYIRPGTYDINSVFHRVTTDEISGIPAPMFRCEGERFYETHFNFAFGNKGLIRSMVCREFFDSCLGEHLSMEKIRVILGENFVLE